MLLFLSALSLSPLCGTSTDSLYTEIGICVHCCCRRRRTIDSSGIPIFFNDEVCHVLYLSRLSVETRLLPNSIGLPIDATGLLVPLPALECRRVHFCKGDELYRSKTLHWWSNTDNSLTKLNAAIQLIFLLSLTPPPARHHPYSAGCYKSE